MIELFIDKLWSFVLEISPYLIMGFFFSGILSVVLSVETVTKYLGKNKSSSVFLASLFGIPLPLCSCGVIPVFSYLKKHGASKSATTSFLISTPQTGVDSIMITYSLLGPIFAIYRPGKRMLGLARAGLARQRQAGLGQAKLVAWPSKSRPDQATAG